MAEDSAGAGKSDEALPYTGEVDTDDVAVGVITAIAEVEGVEMLNLDIRLYDEINTDALDTLVGGSSDNANLTISFTAGNYRVTVDGHGSLHIE